MKKKKKEEEEEDYIHANVWGRIVLLKSKYFK